MSWPLVRLGEMLTHYQEYIESPQPRLYPKLSVRLYGKGVVLDTPTDGSTLRMKRHQLAKAGQVILSEIWGKKGAIGFVPPEGDGALCTSHFFLFNVDTDCLHPNWLQAIFDANYLQDQLDAEAKGTTGYAAVRPKMLLNCVAPLPPLTEQRRVLQRIEELLTGIQEAHNLRKRATEETAALWPSTASRVFQQLEQNFPLLPVTEVVSIHGGGTPSKANPFYWSGSLPWVTPKDMKAREIHDALDHISEEATAHSSAKPIAPGAVLVVVRGMILAHTFPSAVLRARAAINQDMKALIPAPQISADYLCTFFWASNNRILSLVEKSTHDTRKLETSKLREIKLPIPPMTEQIRIVAELKNLADEVQVLKALQAETARELNALIPSILDKAFRGEL